MFCKNVTDVQQKLCWGYFEQWQDLYPWYWCTGGQGCQDHWLDSIICVYQTSFFGNPGAETQRQRHWNWGIFEVIQQTSVSSNQTNQLHFSKRLGAAAAEMEYGEEDGNFDIVIVNDNLETAYIELRDFVMPQLENLHEAKNPSS